LSELEAVERYIRRLELELKKQEFGKPLHHRTDGEQLAWNAAFLRAYIAIHAVRKL
jgi:hypothetical protein